MLLQRVYHSQASEAVARIDSRFRHKQKNKQYYTIGTLPKSNIKIVERDILPAFAFLILKTGIPNVVDGDPRTKLSIKMSI